MLGLRAVVNFIEPNVVQLSVVDLNDDSKKIQAQIEIDDPHIRDEVIDLLYFPTEEINGGLYGTELDPAIINEVFLLEILKDALKRAR